MKNRFEAKEKNKVKDRNWKMFAVLLASGEDEYKGEGRKKIYHPHNVFIVVTKLIDFTDHEKSKVFFWKLPNKKSKKSEIS